MQFHPDNDQYAVAQAIEGSLASLLPLSRLHQSDEESETVWSTLQEMGIFSIGLSESKGGSGLGAVVESLIAITLGRYLAAPSVFAALGVSHAGEPYFDLAALRVAAAFQEGGRILVINGRHAKHALVRTPAGAVLRDIDVIDIRPVESQLWLCELAEITTAGTVLAHFEPATSLRLRLIDAAALAGIAQTALDMSVAYALSREQFGRPIGSFQAIKHHCANMAMAARCARDQTAFAAVAIDARRRDAAFQVESALFIAGSAALDNSGKAVQIHGGFGFSDEADPHLLVKRTQLQLAVAGGLEASVGRIANLNAPW